LKTAKAIDSIFPTVKDRLRLCKIRPRRQLRLELVRFGRIGKEIAITFVREGAKVAIADLNQKAAAATAAELDAAGGSAAA
jgi:hypothetical protein